MNYLITVLIGMLLGAWFFISKGTLLVLACAGAALYAVLGRIGPLKRRRIMLILAMAMLLPRLIISVVHHYSALASGEGIDFMPDARAYSASGQYIGEAITGRSMSAGDNNEPEWLEILRNNYKGNMPPIEYRVDAYARYLGAVYAFLGYDPLAVKFLNCAFALFTAFIIYFLAMKLFSFRVAVAAFIIYAFMPSIFLWSITGMKDPLIFFFTMLFVYIYVAHLRDRLDLPLFFLLAAFLVSSNIHAVILFMALLAAVTYAREKGDMAKRFKGAGYFAALSLALKASLFVVRGIRSHLFLNLLIALVLSAVSLMKKKGIVIILAVICVIVLLYPFYKNDTIDVKKIFGYISREAISHQYSQRNSANSSYRIYPEEYYDNPDLKVPFKDFMICYVAGAVFALFTPCPFSISGNAFMALASIQMLFVYMLIPFAILGVVIAIRYRWRDVAMPLLFVFNTASLLVVCEGNVGTVFRHRDILTSFFAIFAAVGIAKIAGWAVLDGDHAR